MNLTLPELETYLSLSRYQIAKYAADGRLTRTGQGKYAAASLANLAEQFDRFRYGRNAVEERAIWLIRQEHEFRRTLRRLIENRHFAKSRPATLSDVEAATVEAAVSAYVAILKSRPDR